MAWFGVRLVAAEIACAVVTAVPVAAQHAHGPATPRRSAPPQAAPAPPTLPAAAQAQVDQVARAVARFRDFRVAEREGWKRFGGDEPLMGEHWRHDASPDYQGPDAQLDFARPSNLMYSEIGGRRVLTGVAFIVRLAPGEPLPEGFAGRADRWHVHDMPAAIAAATETRPFLRWIANHWLHSQYTSRGDPRGRLAMVHVWVTLPNPDGVFADTNRVIPYLRLGLPASLADGASEAAARGLNLATRNGCAESVDGRLWVADAPSATGRRIRAACDAAAAQVRAALGRDPARLNHAAELAWHGFEQVWTRELTPQQRARIDAITEHRAGHRH